MAAEVAGLDFPRLQLRWVLPANRKFCLVSLQGSGPAAEDAPPLSCSSALIGKEIVDWIRRGSAAVPLRNLTAQTLPTRVWMAPSLSPASTAFSVKKK